MIHLAIKSLLITILFSGFVIGSASANELTPPHCQIVLAIKSPQLIEVRSKMFRVFSELFRGEGQVPNANDFHHNRPDIIDHFRERGIFNQPSLVYRSMLEIFGSFDNAVGAIGAVSSQFRTVEEKRDKNRRQGYVLNKRRLAADAVRIKPREEWVRRVRSFFSKNKISKFPTKANVIPKDVAMFEWSESVLQDAQSVFFEMAKLGAERDLTFGSRPLTLNEVILDIEGEFSIFLSMRYGRLVTAIEWVQVIQYFWGSWNNFVAGNPVLISTVDASRPSLLLEQLDFYFPRPKGNFHGDYVLLLEINAALAENAKSFNRTFDFSHFANSMKVRFPDFYYVNGKTIKELIKNWQNILLSEYNLPKE